MDMMDDKLMKEYAAFPERLYIVLDGKIEYKGGMGPFDYKIDEVEGWLKKYS